MKVIYTYVMKKCFYLFVYLVETTESINKGLRPKDAKSSVGGLRLFFVFVVFFWESVYHSTFYY